MADLSEKDASDSTKIIGSGASGTETNYVDAASDGAMYTREKSIPAFCAISLSTAIALNKSMISVLNATGSPVILKIQAIKIINVQATTITGVLAEFRALRCSGHSAGTVITPISYDSTDVLNANVTARTGATLTGLGTVPFFRYFWSSDEWAPGSPDVESSDHVEQSVAFAYTTRPGLKPITLQPGEGFTIQQLTSSTAGTFDFEMIFSQE